MTLFGWIAISTSDAQTEREFLEALGVDVGGYDPRDSKFYGCKVSETAMAVLEPYWMSRFIWSLGDLEAEEFTPFPVAVCEAVIAAMHELGIHKAELARRLGVSRSAVTQMLAGDNWTLDRFQAVAEALGAKIEVKLVLPSETEQQGGSNAN